MADKLATKPVRRGLSVLSTPIGAAFTNAEMQFRIPQAIPQVTRRWRMHLRNYNVLGDAPNTGGASFLPVFLGRQAFDSNGLETSSFTATPVQALPAFTLPADGSEYTSGWVTDPAAQWPAGIPMMLDLAYTGGTGTQQYGTNKMFFSNGAGKAAGVGSINGSTGIAAIYACIFDIRIEYEFAGDKQVIAVLGDSTTAGNGGGAGAPFTAWKRWPERYGQRTGHAVANGGVPSSTISGIWKDATKWAFRRLKPESVTYDAILSSIGINDTSGGSAATFMGNHPLHVAACRTAFGNKRIFSSALKPYDPGATAGTGYPHGRLVAPVSVGATTISSTANWANGDVLQIGGGYTGESVTVSGSPTGSAPGPYTVTLTTALTKKHDAGEVVAGYRETQRLLSNEYLAALPSGIHGFHRTDRAVAASHDPSLWEPSMTVDGLHANEAGHAAEANFLPNVERAV